MPVIKNKKTGKVYTVTNEGLDKIKSNPMLSSAFVFPENAVKIPPEVLELRRQLKQEAEQAGELVKEDEQAFSYDEPEMAGEKKHKRKKQNKA